MSPKLIHITTVPMSLTFFRGQIAFMKERGYHVYAVSSPGPDLEAFAQREGCGGERRTHVAPDHSLSATSLAIRAA
jgi:hypothetical protein